MRRPREVIECLPGPGGTGFSYIVDINGQRSVENVDTLATILLTHWPDVAMRIAHAWRPIELEEVE